MHKRKINFCLGFNSGAELLIQNGANVNFVAENGQTALIDAAGKGKNSSFIAFTELKIQYNFF